MVYIYYFSIDFIKIKINFKNNEDEQNFTRELIKEKMPVRIYRPDLYAWLIPVRDFGKLIKLLKSEGIKFNIPKTKKIIRLRRKYFDWKQEQLKIKNLYLHKTPNINDLVFFQKEMDILNLTLHPFQSVGAYFSFNSQASLICDPVGLGKTVQALACAEKRIIEKETNFNIVICPSTLKKNWFDEICKFTNRSVIVVSGHKAIRKKIYKQAYKYEYLIVNYDIISNDMGMIKEYILDKFFDINLIVDEIQYTNNRKAKRSKATLEISQNSEYVVGLSATLLENSVMDLFNSFQIIDKTVFGDNTQYYGFVKRYCKTDFFGSIKGYRNPKALKKRIDPFFIKRLKEHVLNELPDKIENNYWIELSKEQRSFYDKMNKKLLDEIDDMEKRQKISMASVLPMITYLRQCVLSTQLVGSKKNISSKSNELFEIINQIPKKSKIVLFCRHPEMIELLYDDLTKKGYNCMAMHGKRKYRFYCPIDERIDSVKEWDSDKSYKFLLASDILREGVNIFSANYLINFDLLFNPFKVEQRIGRIDRLGNKHKVINIINLIAKNTVEDIVYEKFYTKREMSKEVMDGNVTEQRLTTLDITNIKNLFAIRKNETQAKN